MQDDPRLKSILIRLARPKLRRDEQAAAQELGATWQQFEAELIEVLRDSTLDDEAAALGYRPKTPRELILGALFQKPTPARIKKVLFLLDDDDARIRAGFAYAVAAVGRPFVLGYVERALHDPHRDVRMYTTYGLRDAICNRAGTQFARAAAALMVALLKRHPEDNNVAIFEALEHVDPSLVETAQASVAHAKEVDVSQPYFRLKEASAPWGDYGHVLVNGISWNTARDARGRIQLERTGPFVPPITFPDAAGDIVVTAAFRKALEASELRGFKFVPVVKKRIVLLRWDQWDRERAPMRYPAGGEPQNYVLKRKHVPGLAAQLPDLFELCPTAATLKSLTVKSSARSRGSPDFVRLPTGTWPNVVSRGAMRWLRRRAGDWVSFEPLVPKQSS